MNRGSLLEALAQDPSFDIAIIGGGATGLGAAVDAASRGYRTLLIEQFDFAKGTSSRSTKLVHGGVRYLQQGNIKLVMDALRERGILKQNAPHLVKNQSFIVPNYKWWEGPYYGLGLKVYDWMSGSLGLGASEWLSTEAVLALAPTLSPDGLKGGVMYHDGQFDDARLAINLAQTAVAQGAIVLNYVKACNLLKEGQKITGIHLRDELSGAEHTIRARAVVNAGGVFSDTIQRMDNPGHEATITPSQGIHIVLDCTFLPGQTAIMIPHTDDGRVLFAVPWHNRVIVGTTDTPVKEIVPEPAAREEEIDFILRHAAQYLTKDPQRSDIKSVFAGLRPLVRSTAKKTAEVSRDHSILLSPSGLISVIGGKWTTYRKMAEDAVNTAAIQAGLPYKECVTHNLPIHGSCLTSDFERPGYYYGADQDKIRARATENPDWNEPLHPDLPYTKGDIIWAAQEECCMTVEDALSRRTRALILDAAAARDAAPRVAAWLATEWGKDSEWIAQQLISFRKTVSHYLPK